MIAAKYSGIPASPQNQQKSIKNLESQEKNNQQPQPQHQHQLKQLQQSRQQQEQQHNETRSEKQATGNGQQQACQRLGSLAEEAHQPSPATPTKIQLKQQKFLAAAAKCSATITASATHSGSGQTVPGATQDKHHQNQLQQQQPPSQDQQPASEAAQLAVAPLSVACPSSSTNTVGEPLATQAKFLQRTLASMSTDSSSARVASTHLQRSQQQAIAMAAAAAAPTTTMAATVLSPTANAQILIENYERRVDFVSSKTATTVVSAGVEVERRQRVRSGEFERRSNENDVPQQPPAQRQRLHNINISNNYNQNHHHHHHHHNHNHQHYNQHHQHQHHHHHHHQNQHTMAHYKFHNDCQSSVLTYEQVKRLDFVMDQTVPIHGRGNFPTLYVKLKELIRLVKYKLQVEHSIEIRDVRLNGGAASFVLAPENSHYNDLDLIFGTDLSNEDQFDVIRDVVLECLKEFYPKEKLQLQQQQQQQQEEHYFDKEPARDVKKTVIKEGPNCSEAAEYSADFEGGDVGENSSGSSPSRGRSMLCNSNNLKIIMKGSDYDGNVRFGVNCEGDENHYGRSDEEGRVKKRQTGSGSFADNGVGAINDKSIGERGGSGNSIAMEQQQLAHTTQNFQYQHQTYQMPLSNCAVKEAYVHKMVKVNDDDRWSLISLGVQQSEASCCPNQQANCNNNSNCSLFQRVGCGQQQQQQQQQQQPQPQQHQNQFTACVLNNENETISGLIHQSSAQIVSNDNSSLNTQAIVTNSTQQHYQPSVSCIYHHQHHHNHHHHQQQNQRDHYQQQQKQFPNSIELKFVDKMRRKFEFSVDSFQIILDSLLQFYDYAPQSTITSQRKMMNSHLSSTMINIRPLVNRRRCSVCCASRTVIDCKPYENNLGSLSKANTHKENPNLQHNQRTINHQRHQNHNLHHQEQRVNTSLLETKQPCGSLLNSSRSYYQLPIDPENSPSISSVASSSGCSSSSSVVSSSSSSLSCDEDHEDLYCDADCPSSSSASTSSLLSSTNSSSLCSDVNTSSNAVEKSTNCLNERNYNLQDSANHSEDQAEISANQRSMLRRHQSKEHFNRNLLNRGNSCCKLNLVPTNADLDHHSASSEANPGECLEFFRQQQNLTNDVCHFETSSNWTSCAVISENFYPTVIGRSEYGNFKEALYHLEKKLIATRSPEEIRGGGLLKYCNLLVKNYKPTNVYQIRTLERYMCSRFFIDFSDLNQQQAKLESYLANHFFDDPVLKFDYLTILHNVVQRSTVCLMNHELRLTLNMIRDLAYKLNEQQHQSQLQNHSQQFTAQRVQQSNQAQAQQQQKKHQYYQQEPVLIQSGIYRVKLVNYALAKTVKP